MLRSFYSTTISSSSPLRSSSLVIFGRNANNNKLLLLLNAGRYNTIAPVISSNTFIRTIANKVGSGHSDFMPQDKKTSTNSNEKQTSTSSSKNKPEAAEDNKNKNDDEPTNVQEWLGQVVKQHPVLLFMKGTPEAPSCGFSRKVAVILKDNHAKFAAADVLTSPEVREGIKVFSNWPTIPQLYIGGQFVGGCDIVTSLNESGELKEMLKKVGAIREESSSNSTDEKSN
jgi:monothiol glutaredoxin